MNPKSSRVKGTVSGPLDDTIFEFEKLLAVTFSHVQSNASLVAVPQHLSSHSRQLYLQNALPRRVNGSQPFLAQVGVLQHGECHASDPLTSVRPSRRPTTLSVSADRNAVAQYVGEDGNALAVIFL